MTHMASHGLPVLLGSDLKAHILEGTKTSHIELEFSNGRCGIISMAGVKLTNIVSPTMWADKS